MFHSYGSSYVCGGGYGGAFQLTGVDCPLTYAPGGAAYGVGYTTCAGGMGIAGPWRWGIFTEDKAVSETSVATVSITLLSPSDERDYTSNKNYEDNKENTTPATAPLTELDEPREPFS